MDNRHQQGLCRFIFLKINVRNHEKVSFIDHSSGGGSRTAYGMQRDTDGDDEKRVLAERGYELRDPDQDDRKLRRDEKGELLMQNAK